jgi:hypothetical protein
MLSVEEVMIENMADYSEFFPCIANTIKHPISANSCAILHCLLYILKLISSYMFRRNRHHQGAYINVVKSYSNKTVLQ